MGLALLCLLALAGQPTTTSSSAPTATVAAAQTSTPAVVVTVVEAPAESGVEEIVVTGSRGARRRSEAPVATEVISRREIESSGATNMGQLLEQHPGVELERTTRGTNVRLQGLDSEYVLILIDGERMTGKVGGGVDLSRLNLEDIAQVEIVKGASSALYGADAIGGVINILTREPKKPLETDVRLMYGRADKDCDIGCLNAFDVTGGAGIRRGPFWLRADGGYHRADGYRLSGDAAAPPSPRDALLTTGASTRGGEWALRGGLRLSPDTTLGFRAGFEQIDLTAVDPVPTSDQGILDRDQRSTVWSAILRGETQLDANSRIKLSGSFSLFRLQIRFDQRGDDALDSLTDDHQTIGQLTAQYERLAFERHELTFGVEGLLERQSVQYLGDQARDRYRGAVYAQDEWKVLDGSPKLIIVPGIRGDGDTKFGGAVSPKLAVRYDPVDTLRLRASYGLGFRAPTFEELYLSFVNAGSGYQVTGCLVPTEAQPSPAGCRAELAHSAHAGGEYDLGKGFTIGVDGFLHEIQNLITTIRTEHPGALTEFRYTNVASAQTRGIEAQLSIRPLELAEVKAVSLSMELGYTFTDTIDREHDRALEGRAKHRGTMRLAFSWYQAGLDASIRASLVGPRPYYQRDPPETAAGYASLGFQIAKSLVDQLSLFVGADNLFDAGDPRFLPIPPRRFYAGVAGKLSVEEDEDGDVR